MGPVVICRHCDVNPVLVWWDGGGRGGRGQAGFVLPFNRGGSGVGVCGCWALCARFEAGIMPALKHKQRRRRRQGNPGKLLARVEREAAFLFFVFIRKMEKNNNYRARRKPLSLSFSKNGKRGGGGRDSSWAEGYYVWWWEMKVEGVSKARKGGRDLEQKVRAQEADGARRVFVGTGPHGLVGGELSVGADGHPPCEVLRVRMRDNGGEVGRPPTVYMREMWQAVREMGAIGRGDPRDGAAQGSEGTDAQVAPPRGESGEGHGTPCEWGSGSPPAGHWLRRALRVPGWA